MGNREWVGKGGGGISFLQADAYWREDWPAKMASVGAVREGLNTGTLAAVPSALSPEPQTQSLLTLLWSTACRPPSVGAQGEQLPIRFVCLLFKRLPWFLVDSCLSLRTESPFICTDSYYVGSCGLSWEAWHGVRRPQGGPLQVGHPFGCSAVTPACRASTFHLSAFLTSLHVASSANLWFWVLFSSRLQLVTQLLRLIVLYFHCNSSLVLVGCECNFYSICCPLGCLGNNRNLYEEEHWDWEMLS